jgi:hypothetical protein
MRHDVSRYHHQPRINRPPVCALLSPSGLGGFGRLLWASILLEPTSDETPSASGHRAGCRDPESRSPWSPWRAWRAWGGWAHCDATHGAAGVTARVAAADGTLGATDGATHVAWHGPMAWLGGLLTCYGPHIHITQGLGAALSAGARWRCRAGHADMSNAS